MQEGAVAQVVDFAAHAHRHVHGEARFQERAFEMRDAGAIAFGLAAGAAAFAAARSEYENCLAHVN